MAVYRPQTFGQMRYGGAIRTPSSANERSQVNVTSLPSVEGDSVKFTWNGVLQPPPIHDIYDNSNPHQELIDDLIKRHACLIPVAGTSAELSPSSYVAVFVKSKIGGKITIGTIDRYICDESIMVQYGSMIKNNVSLLKLLVEKLKVFAVDAEIKSSRFHITGGCKIVKHPTSEDFPSLLIIPSPDPDIMQCTAQIRFWHLPVYSVIDYADSSSVLAAYRLRFDEYERQYGRMKNSQIKPKDDGKTSTLSHYMDFVNELDVRPLQLFVQAMVDVMGWEEAAQAIESAHTPNFKDGSIYVFTHVQSKSYEAKNDKSIAQLHTIQDRGATLLNYLWANHCILHCQTQHLSDFVSVPKYGKMKKVLKEHFDLAIANKIMSALPDYCIPPRLRLSDDHSSYFMFEWLRPTAPPQED